ncbi:MAG: UPF0016 family protein [Alphaproteobacteria bacterium]|nr:UPF0016 family protein [Alphaproteobacteria bacterium]
MKYAMIVFASVFLAELGDKTQLATLLFSAEGKIHPALVFAAASVALVLSTGIAVALGVMAERYLHALPLKLIAGSGFILIGAFTIVDHFSAT